LLKLLKIHEMAASSSAWCINCIPEAPMTKEAYARAYQDGMPLTLRFLLSRGVARDMAEEVSQAAWMRGWERLSQLRNDKMISTWVNTIALNIYRRAIRYERRIQTLEDPMYAKSTMNWAALDLGRILRFCRLPDRQILEAQMGGRTAEEIAQEQGLSQTAVRIRLLRARRAARHAAEKIHMHGDRTGGRRLSTSASKTAAAAA
jgi:DNA-directed RNA polymerase specialized sigma24 family protein